jgi:putative transposase
MPDHLHLLIEGLCANSDLLRFMKMFRQRSGHSYRTRKNVRLWQEGFVDTFLRAEEASLDVARYVVANPGRAGLVQDARDYPYLGSTRYSIDELVGSLA